MVLIPVIGNDSRVEMSQMYFVRAEWDISQKLALFCKKTRTSSPGYR